mmetsp:Transcript_2000/g.4941  ORF Transcript_2000/g.4941 Transcript_2000/m.4941 type:complete len:201 (-) Transcript_2000:202-804(-)
MAYIPPRAPVIFMVTRDMPGTFVMPHRCMIFRAFFSARFCFGGAAAIIGAAVGGGISGMVGISVVSKSGTSSTSISSFLAVVVVVVVSVIVVSIVVVVLVVVVVVILDGVTGAGAASFFVATGVVDGVIVGVALRFAFFAFGDAIGLSNLAVLKSCSVLAAACFFSASDRLASLCFAMKDCSRSSSLAPATFKLSMASFA